MQVSEAASLAQVAIVQKLDPISCQIISSLYGFDGRTVKREEVCRRLFLSPNELTRLEANALRQLAGTSGTEVGLLLRH